MPNRVRTWNGPVIDSDVIKNIFRKQPEISYDANLREPPPLPPPSPDAPAIPDSFSTTEISLSPISQSFSQKTYVPVFITPAISVLGEPKINIESPFGFLFSDQTRIKPNGLSVGEHVYTLSLAPQETVTLVQKSYTKSSFKNTVTDQMSLDTETESSSSNSTDLNTRVQEEIHRSETLSVGANANVQFGSGSTGPSGGGGGSVNKNWSDASSEVEDVTTTRASSIVRKAAQKARAEHKTEFSIENTSYSSSSTKKVVKNMNVGHTLMLNYFKVFQNFKVQVLRCDMQLCWSIFIKDPGKSVRKSNQSVEDEFADYLDFNKITIPGFENPPSEKVVVSNKVMLRAVGWINEDADSSLVVPPGYELVSYSGISSSGRIEAPWDKNRRQPPQGSTGTVIIPWHIHLDQGQGDYVEFYTEATVRPLSQTLMAWYQQLYAAKEAELERRKVEVQSKYKSSSFQSYKYDEKTELMRRVLEDNDIKYTNIDDGAEVSEWHRIFDWNAMSYQLFPPWWNRETVGIQSYLTDFLNASWARVFVPINKGKEKDALDLLNKFLVKLSPNGTDLIVANVKNAQDFFAQQGPQVLSDFSEQMPTDGTYCEPLLGGQVACDNYLLKDIEAAQRGAPRPTPADEDGPDQDFDF